MALVWLIIAILIVAPMLWGIGRFVDWILSYTRWHS